MQRQGKKQGEGRREKDDLLGGVGWKSIGMVYWREGGILQFGSMPACIIHPLQVSPFPSPPPKTHATILFLLLLITVHSDPTSGQFTSSSGCTITYENPTNSNFRFICISPESVYLNWSSCLLRCCPASPLPPPLPSLPALSACNPSKPTDNTTLVLMAVLISVFSLITFLCLSLLLYKLCVTCGRNKVVQEDSGTEWDTPQDLTLSSTSPLWLKTARNRYEESECSICLDAGGNAQLVCGHSYHRNCILSWLKRSHFCPLCHREQIRTLKLHCPTCSTHCLLAKTALLEQHPELGNECPQCENAGREQANSETKVGNVAERLNQSVSSLKFN